MHSCIERQCKRSLKSSLIFNVLIKTNTFLVVNKMIKICLANPPPSLILVISMIDEIEKQKSILPIIGLILF